MKSIFESLYGVKDALLSAGEMLGLLGIGVVVGIMGAIKKRKINLGWNSKKDKMFVEKHGRIHELLTELRVTIRASRCAIFQFHNGGSFADGMSIKRFSVTHESCDTGTNSVLLESQDALVTRYLDVIAVMNESPGKIVAVSSLSPSAFRSCLEINSVEYFSVVPLRLFDGLTTLGFVCCHWRSADPLDEMEKEGITQNELQELILNSVGNINSYFSINRRYGR